MYLYHHLLLPCPADWRQPPLWSRRWQTEVVAGPDGSEARFTPSLWPRAALAYRVTARSAAERAWIERLLRAALEIGRACCPYWGWGQGLSGWARDGDHAEARVPDGGWVWQVGDGVFLAPPGWSSLAPELFPGEAASVTQADLTGGQWTLELAGALEGDYPPPALAWPLLFGELVAGKFDSSSNLWGSITLTLTEHTPRLAHQLGAAPSDPGPGLGGMAIGTTFLVA